MDQASAQLDAFTLPNNNLRSDSNPEFHGRTLGAIPSLGTNQKC
jgi:hypothetical protein